jgi:hypothetical protein
VGIWKGVKMKLTTSSVTVLEEPFAWTLGELSSSPSPRITAKPRPE